MNKRERILLSVLFLLMFHTLDILSQISTNINPIDNNIQVRFLKDKIETQPNTSIFNLLKIKNNSVQQFSGNVKLSTPNNWNLFGENSIPIRISPGDSVNIPVRVAVSKDAVGEVGYIIVATITNNNEKLVKTSYCFVNIPRKTNLKVRLDNKINYFNIKTGEATVNYIIENNGNINEVVHLELNGRKLLKVNNQIDNNNYVDEISLPAHSDTIVAFKVKYIEQDNNKMFYLLNVQASTQDTMFNNTAWLNRVESSFEYKIPENKKCAIFQLFANNLLSKDPTFSLMAKGNILFKKNTSIYYYARTTTWDFNNLDNIYNTNSRFHVGFKNTFSDIRFGNIYTQLQQYFNGLGITADFQFSNFKFGGFYLEGLNFKGNYYGGNLGLSIKRKIWTEFGYGDMSVVPLEQYTQIGTFETNFSLNKKNNIRLYAGANITDHRMYQPYQRLGYGFAFDYKGSFDKFNIGIRADYGSPEYTGISRGRFTINSNLFYKIKGNSYLNFNFLKRDYNPAYYVNDVLQPIYYRNYSAYKLEYMKNYFKNFDFFWGSEFIIEKTNQLRDPFLNFPEFETYNYRLFIKAKIRIPNSRIELTPHLDIGNIQVMQADDIANSPEKSYFTYNFYFNITAKYFGMLFQYRNGPFQIYEQFYNYYNNYYSKWLYIMPYYNRFLIKDILKLSLRGTYQSNLVSISRPTNFTITTRFDWYLPRSWELYVLNSSSFRTRKDVVTGGTLRYSTNYIELGVKKEFNCRQPRVKFYDLKIIYYRDLNGNRKKDQNEPGINTVLASIKPAFNDTADNIVHPEFVSTELLSNTQGEIEYKNIPDGYYQVNYRIMSKMVGNFNMEELHTTFVMNKDKTIYIPYLENNKIFGKVILNRDPLSSLGNIKISNIRITAEDTKGNTFSALTDKNGAFVLYTPVTDYYIVKINNIFYESFELQQNEFIVKFNGYKQFEVTFIFNEKKRKINFDEQLNNEDEQLEDLKVIRKTTLSGKIRDAISLKPIEAEVKIIDNKNNKLISSATSNRLNGNYNLSYVAGDHFRIEVTAKNYKKYVENLYIEQVISIQNINKDIMLSSASSEEEQQTFVIYKEKEKDFTQNYKRGQKIPINYLNFKEKETRLAPNAYPELDRLIDILNANKSVHIEIGGHANDGDNARINNILALRRAKAVAKYLNRHGLSEDRYTVKSYSNTRPLIPGANEKARQKNRRVEIIVQ